MKLLIVGLGSMGKRRARLAKGMDAGIQIVGVDSAESRRAEAVSLGLADAVYPSIAEAAAGGMVSAGARSSSVSALAEVRSRVKLRLAATPFRVWAARKATSWSPAAMAAVSSA